MSGRFSQLEQRLCAVGLCAALVMAVITPAHEAVLAAEREASAAVEVISEPQIAASAAGYAVNSASGGASDSHTSGGRTIAGKYATSVLLRRLSKASVSGGDSGTAAPVTAVAAALKERGTAQTDADRTGPSGASVVASGADAADDQPVTAGAVNADSGSALAAVALQADSKEASDGIASADGRAGVSTSALAAAALQADSKEVSDGSASAGGKANANASPLAAAALQADSKEVSDSSASAGGKANANASPLAAAALQADSKEALTGSAPADGNAGMSASALAAAALQADSQGASIDSTSAGSPPADNGSPSAAAPQTGTGTPAEEASAPGGEKAAEAAAPDTQGAPAERVFTAEEEAKLASFYANTVLAGDSVLLGFRNYCRSAGPLMQKLQFLAAGSYSLHNAFWEISGKSVHPIYQGAQHKLWDSVGMIMPNRIFLFFGINDMAFGVDDSVTLYEELIARVKEADPAARIYLISATYVLEGTGKKGLNNSNLARFNQIMMQKAAANGWGYVDMATPTSDGRGNLMPSCCSDGHLHQTKSAYVIWERVLKEYALREIAAGR